MSETKTANVYNLQHCEGAEWLQPIMGEQSPIWALNTLDVAHRISAFVKLKLTNCAPTPGLPTVGFFMKPTGVGWVKAADGLPRGTTRVPPCPRGRVRNSFGIARGHGGNLAVDGSKLPGRLCPPYRASRSDSNFQNPVLEPTHQGVNPKSETHEQGTVLARGEPDPKASGVRAAESSSFRGSRASAKGGSPTHGCLFFSCN